MSSNVDALVRTLTAVRPLLLLAGNTGWCSVSCCSRDHRDAGTGTIDMMMMMTPMMMMMMTPGQTQHHPRLWHLLLLRCRCGSHGRGERDVADHGDGSLLLLLGGGLHGGGCDGGSCCCCC